MKKVLAPIVLIGLLITAMSWTISSNSTELSVEQEEKEKAPKEYIKHRHDHDKKQDYLKNKHNSKDIVVKLPRCKLPLANCIGGCTSTMTIVVEAGSREYLPKDYVYCADKLKAEFEK